MTMIGVAGRALPRSICKKRAIEAVLAASARSPPNPAASAPSPRPSPFPPACGPFRFQSHLSSSTAPPARQYQLVDASVSSSGDNDSGDNGDASSSSEQSRCPVHSGEPSDPSLSEPGVAWARGVGPSVHYKHCTTCTCGAVSVGEEDDDGGEDDKASSAAADEDGAEDGAEHDRSCPISASSSDPLPPPLPEPKYSFHKRVMPPNLTALSSPEGKKMFLDALRSGDAESYFPLAEQFMNQSDPAFCGVTTLCMVLNAMSVDPGVRWRGGWRWYGDDSVVLANCCLDMERVRRAGISVEEFVSLGRCQGARVVLRRPVLPPPPADGDCERGEGSDGAASSSSTGASPPQGRYSLEQFRDDVQFMVRNPPPYVAEDEGGNGIDDAGEEGDGRGEKKRPTAPPPPSPNAGGFLVVSYARSALSQTGEGHYSPVAAYHSATDSALVLDVARFKYAPYWVGVRELYDATVPLDGTTGLSRGWLLMYPPRGSSGAGGYRGTVKTDEGRRPAETVPAVGERDACPVGEIKVEFCRAKAKKAIANTNAKTTVDPVGRDRVTARAKSGPAQRRDDYK